MKRRLFAILLSLTLVLMLSLTGLAQESSGKLIILHTNDMHGSGVADAAKGVIGFPIWAQLSGYEHAGKNEEKRIYDKGRVYRNIAQ